MSNRDPEDFLCSGLVYCSCGAKMHAHISKRKGHEYFYCKCPESCGASVARMEDVDNAALEMAEAPKDYTSDEVRAWMKPIKDAPSDKAVQT